MPPRFINLYVKEDLLSCLPFEIIFEIIFKLPDIQSLCQLSNVSKAWYCIIRSNEIWKKKFTRRYKLPSPRPFMMDWYQVYKQHHILNNRWNSGQVKTHYLIGHEDSVYCLQFDKTKIITASRDRTIKVWGLLNDNYECIKTLEGHEASVLALKFDETRMVSGSSDTTLIVWNIQTFEMIMRLRGHTAGVLDVCFNQDTIFSCSKDRTIRLWNIHTGKLTRTIYAHRGPVNAIQLHQNYLVSASGDTLIKLWDIRTGECLRKFAGHTRGLACIQYNGRYIVSGSNDKTIKIWDTEVYNQYLIRIYRFINLFIKSGECLNTLEGHTDLVRTICFKEDRIVSASYDQSIRVWSLRTGKCLLNFQSGHSSWVFDVHFDSTKIIRCVFGKLILHFN